MRRVLRRGVPLVVAFLVGAAMIGSAWAAVTKIKGNLVVTGTVKAKNFRYARPKTNRLVIPGAAFVPNNNTTQFTHHGYSGAAEPGSGHEMVAPVNLPHGAVVTRVLWYHDNGNAGRAELHLESNDRVFSHDDMVFGDNVACTDTPCVTSFGSVSPNVVNNNRRHYGIWLMDEGTADRIATLSVVIVYRTFAVGPASSSLPSGPGLSWQGGGSEGH